MAVIREEDKSGNLRIPLFWFNSSLIAYWPARLLASEIVFFFAFKLFTLFSRSDMAGVFNNDDQSGGF